MVRYRSPYSSNQSRCRRSFKNNQSDQSLRSLQHKANGWPLLHLYNLHRSLLRPLFQLFQAALPDSRTRSVHYDSRVIVSSSFSRRASYDPEESDEGEWDIQNSIEMLLIREWSRQ